MAQKFRKVDPRIWTDESFRRLGVDEKILAFWLLTGSRVNRCGIVLWSGGLASEETGISPNSIDTVCDTVCDTLSWFRDTVSNTVFLRRWWRYNRPDNADALKGFLSDLHDVPSNGLKDALVQAAQDLPSNLHTVYFGVLDTVYDTVSNTVSPQEKEKEKEKKKDTILAARPPVSTDGRKRFCKPTPQEVDSYCKERNNGISGQDFVDFYEARGWKHSKGIGMSDWRAAIRTWEKNKKESVKSCTPQQKPHPYYPATPIPTRRPSNSPASSNCSGDATPSAKPKPDVPADIETPF